MDNRLSFIGSQYAFNGNITFPQGFITPKVGPHTTYGFAPGTIYGQPAGLLLKRRFG